MSDKFEWRMSGASLLGAPRSQSCPWWLQCLWDLLCSGLGNTGGHIGQVDLAHHLLCSLALCAGDRERLSPCCPREHFSQVSVALPLFLCDGYLRTDLQDANVPGKSWGQKPRPEAWACPAQSVQLEPVVTEGRRAPEAGLSPGGQGSR